MARLVRTWNRWFWIDVADRARLIVEGASALHPEVFRHRDLDALDMVAVPERLQQRVRKTKEDHVMHRPLAQVMVDAEDRLLVKGCQQDPVELLRGEQDHDRRAFRRSRARRCYSPTCASCSTTTPNKQGGIAR